METAGALLRYYSPPNDKKLPRCREQATHARPGGLIALFATMGRRLWLRLNLCLLRTCPDVVKAASRRWYLQAEAQQCSVNPATWKREAKGKSLGLAYGSRGTHFSMLGSWGAACRYPGAYAAVHVPTSHCFD